MKKTFLIGLTLLLLGAVFAQNEQIHYDIHPKFPHHATAEERLMIPYLSQQAHLRDAVYPAAPATAVAEFQPMGGVMIAYPLGIPVALVRELSQITQVKVLVDSPYDSSQARNYFNNNQVNMDNVQFWRIQHDTYWTRDYGPWFVIDGHDSVGVVDFVYNRPQRTYDDAALESVTERLGVSRYEMPLVHTGGNYMVDGYGTAASTMLVLQENPAETESSILSMTQNYLGIDNYMILPDPLGEYIAHIDCWGKFLDVDKVLIGKVPANDPRYNNYEAVAQTFANAVSPWGNHYQVYRVYANPNANHATPYTNSLILNDHVFVPVTGNSHDNEAIAAYQQAMPGYTIVPIMQSDYTPWYSTDALHCRTHELADLGMLYLKHYPLLGEKNLDDLMDNMMTISVDIKALSGANLVSDSLRIYFRINHGTWHNASLHHTTDNEYTFSFTSINYAWQNGDTVEYYLFAKDESGRVEKHPYIGAADPHLFTITDEVGVTERETKQMHIYPNPATEMVYVALDGGTEIANMVLYDLQGRIVETCLGASLQSGTATLNVEALPAGIYLLRVTGTDGNTYHHKIVKK
ncbi:MAG: agmatine deiminase family protein [Bacteroidales bacterium]|nr:agmatine deiminase family protein [Bacteroidales bacterium]